MSGLMPNFGQVQTRYGAESERPNLWDGLRALWTPPVTPTGLAWRDGSMHHNHGTLTNMNPASDWVMSPHGWALDFDGSNDYVNAGNAQSLDLTGPLTIHVLIYKKSDKNYMGFVEKGTGGNQFYVLRAWTAGNVRFGVADATPTSYAVTTAGGVSIDEWHHIFGIYDGANIIVVVDGQYTVGDAFSGSVRSGSENLIIGADLFDINNRSADVIVASAAIWDRALLPAEIADLYADPFAMLKRRQVVYPSAVNRRRRVLIGAA